MRIAVKYTYQVASYVLFASMLLCEALNAESNKKNDPSSQNSTLVGADIGIGISPTNIFGPRAKYFVSEKLALDASLSISGSRTNTLGAAPGFGASYFFTKKIYLTMGGFGFLGKGKKNVAYSKKCPSPNGNYDYCGSGSEDESHHVIGQRQVSWQYIYGNVGAGILAFPSKNHPHLALLMEIGISSCLSQRLKVSELDDQNEAGAPLGILIDSSYWLGDSIVKKGDTGPYARIGLALEIGDSLN